MQRVSRVIERIQNPPPRSVRTRMGFTIIEILLTVSAISALSVLTITVICLLTSAEQHAAESLFIDLTVANLAADLRDDAHRAVRLEAAPPDGDGRVTSITLVQPGNTRVTYECTTVGVIRRQDNRDGGQFRGDVSARFRQQPL